LVNRELDVTKKKKQALDNLYASNKISQSTYDYLETELAKAITDLEDHLKTLMDKMTERAKELEKQISTLELFLASLEIHHAAGDIDDETYEEQNNAILLGLEATRQELLNIEGSLSETITEPAEAPAAPADLEETTTEAVETAEPTEAEEESEPQVEEPSTFEPMESMEPSQEVATESATEEASESEAVSSGSNLEESSEDLFPEPDTAVGY
jgi:hypothetical protein